MNRKKQERKNLDLLNNLKAYFVICFLLIIVDLIAQESTVDDNNKNKTVRENFSFFSKDHLYGKFKPDSFLSFVRVESQYCYKEIYIVEEVYEAFKEMAKLAAKDSIDLKIISAIRTFDYQKKLWENKWTGKTKVQGHKLNIRIKDHFQRAKKILEYTAPPGFSRHHWGTDIDINSVEDEYFETAEGNKVYDWLQKNAAKFGFCQTYNAHESRHYKGFKEEKWHWSYSKLSNPFLNALLDNFVIEDLSGFTGFQAVRKMNFVNDYILSINRCQ